MTVSSPQNYPLRSLWNGEDILGAEIGRVFGPKIWQGFDGKFHPHLQRGSQVCQGLEDFSAGKDGEGKTGENTG